MNSKTKVTKARLISQAEFARREHVSRQMIGKYVRAGMPTHDGGKVDAAEARRWLRANTTRGNETFSDARARKEAALATLRELELAVKKGELVSKKDVELAFSGVVIAARTNLLNMPDELAPRLVGLSDVRQLRRLIDVEVRAALTELSRSPLPVEQGGKS